MGPVAKLIWFSVAMLTLPVGGFFITYQVMSYQSKN